MEDKLFTFYHPHHGNYYRGNIYQTNTYRPSSEFFQTIRTFSKRLSLSRLLTKYYCAEQVNYDFHLTSATTAMKLNMLLLVASRDFVILAENHFLIYGWINLFLGDPKTSNIIILLLQYRKNYVLFSKGIVQLFQRFLILHQRHYFIFSEKSISANHDYFLLFIHLEHN